MSGSLSSFGSISPINDKFGIEAAFGGISYASQVGSVLLEADGIPALRIEEVHYIAGLNINLLSFERLEGQMFKFSLSQTTPSHVIMQSPEGGIYTFHRTAAVNIFEFGPQESNVDPVISITKASDSLALTQAPPVDAAKPATARSSDSVLPQATSTSKTLCEWHSVLRHVNTRSIVALSKNPSSNIIIKGSKAHYFC